MPSILDDENMLFSTPGSVVAHQQARTIKEPKNVEVYISATSVSVVLVDSKGRKFYFDPPENEITKLWKTDVVGGKKR